MRRVFAAIGAALLDKDDPSKVIGRTASPILSAADEDREGYVPNVVYSCGSLIHGTELILPYAMSDKATAIAAIGAACGFLVHFVLLFGAASFENSALDWSADHRIHHKHVDEDEDPYDISKGFFYAHIGWLLFREHTLTGLGRALSLNPFEAPVAHWRMGLGLVAEAWIYGLPLLIVLPLLKSLHLLPASNDPRLLTWKWTTLQCLALAFCLLGIVILRSSVGSDFIYFAF